MAKKIYTSGVSDSRNAKPNPKMDGSGQGIRANMGRGCGEYKSRGLTLKSMKLEKMKSNRLNNEIYKGQFLKMFNEERKEHPTFTKEQINQIVKDHLAKKHGEKVVEEAEEEDKL
jgi:hypothetical protein